MVQVQHENFLTKYGLLKENVRKIKKEFISTFFIELMKIERTADRNIRATDGRWDISGAPIKRKMVFAIVRDKTSDISFMQAIRAGGKFYSVVTI